MILKESIVDAVHGGSTIKADISVARTSAEYTVLSLDF
jgi:hypothetical protein